MDRMKMIIIITDIPSFLSWWYLHIHTIIPQIIKKKRQACIPKCWLSPLLAIKIQAIEIQKHRKTHVPLYIHGLGLKSTQAPSSLLDLNAGTVRLRIMMNHGTRVQIMVTTYRSFSPSGAIFHIFFREGVSGSEFGCSFFIVDEGKKKAFFYGFSNIFEVR